MITGKYKLTLLQPCEYFTLFDSKGDAYYYREVPQGCKTLFINILHPDEYTANVPFENERIGDIEIGETIPIPDDIERFRLRPIKVVYNPELKGTPARIFTNNNPAIIEIGERFYDFPKEARFFFLLHEYGHLFFKTEWKVDQFAARIFLGLGYNPSQAFFALHDVLGRSEQATDRILRMFNTLKTHNYVGTA